MTRDCSESAPEVGNQPSATPNSRIKQDAGPERRQALAGEHETGQSAFQHAAAPHCHGHAGRNADAECDQQRTGGERHRVGDAFCHDAGDAGALNEALAEIESCEIGEIGNVLHQQRPVEAQGVAQFGNLLGGRTLGNQQQRGIA